MSARWHSLFVPLEDAAPVADALREALAALGYQPYDPFPGGTGTPPGLNALVRLFVAPPQEGFVRVLGEPDVNALPALSTALDMPLLYGWLTTEGGGFAVFRGGARLDDLSAFARPGTPPQQFERALAGTLPVADEPDDAPQAIVLGADALPPELQQLAQDRGVDPGKANKMFERLSGNLLGKLNRQAGGADAGAQAQARDLLGGGESIWNSDAGRRARAIASVLDLPANWRAPTWEAVREAYQLHRLRQRSPRLPLMPGDQEALDTVPDALAYLPVYYGRA